MFLFRGKLANGAAIKFTSAHAGFGAALTEFMRAVSEKGEEVVESFVALTVKRKEGKEALTIIEPSADGAEKPKKPRKAAAKK